MSSTPGIRRIQVSWRRAKARWADFIARHRREQLFEADRGARGARGSRFIRSLRLLGGPIRNHGVHPGVDSIPQLVAVERDPGE